MRRAEQRHSPQRIAKPRELSGLVPQFGTISMKDDGGKRRVFAHKISVTGGQEGLICPRGVNKYVKDEKAAHIVRVWPSGIT